MFSDSAFKFTLIISLAIHGAILLNNFNLNTFSSKETLKKTELSYVKELQKPKEIQAKKEPSPKPILINKDLLLKLPPKINTQEKSPPPFIDENTQFDKNKRPVFGPSAFNKPAFSKPEIVAMKKKINLPPTDVEKINNPTYISYYQIVREKIRRAAYQNYSINQEGEVHLYFIVSCDGYLKEVRLAEEKGPANPALTEISLMSIKDASPFPNFPPDLNYPHLSFNIIISYEIE